MFDKKFAGFKYLTRINEMNFSLKEIETSQLQEFYDNFPGEKTFLQTEKFGKFREILGEKNIIWGIFSDEKLISL